jgi:8-oxo-dGTP pyrophosphatase MutT (NUDIX family)
MKPPVVEKALAYVTQRDRILLFRHPESPATGIQVPAGTIRPGESPQDAALREAEEETGLRGLRVQRYLGEAEFDARPYGRDERHHRHFYHLVYDGSSPESWLHEESDPSDGSGPIPFELFWASLPAARFRLIAGQGTFLSQLCEGAQAMAGLVLGVSVSPEHGFSKPSQSRILLRAGHGVVGDAHAGVTVQHRSRVARDPTQPNLRQVHLIHGELHDELRFAGFDVTPGMLGENVTTLGLDLLALPAGSRLHLGETAVVEITGLRNPCAQLDGIQPGLMAATLDRDADGRLIRKAGVMAIVVADGEVRPDDAIRLELPGGPARPLEPV